MRKNKGYKGFTLLELLIAFALFTVVMVVVGSVFGTGIFAWKRGEGETGFYQELRLTLDRMAVELRNTVPNNVIPFEGKKETLSFLEFHSSRTSSSSEWIQVTYEVKKEGDSAILLRRVSPLLKEEIQEDILLSSFSDIQFSYPVFEGEKWEWKEEWDPGDAKGPPPFVKMALLMEGGEAFDKIFVIPTGEKGNEE